MESNLKMIMAKMGVPMVAAPVEAKTKTGKMRVVQQHRIGLKSTWEEGGGELGVNEGEEEEEEFGYRLSPSQFDLAMEHCSQKARGGSSTVSPAPKKSKPTHISNEDEVMGDAA